MPRGVDDFVFGRRRFEALPDGGERHLWFFECTAAVYKRLYWRPWHARLVLYRVLRLDTGHATSWAKDLGVAQQRLDQKEFIDR